jgi:tripartite-type tricarboxylate transporter receptor subunit TctC
MASRILTFAVALYVALTGDAVAGGWPEKPVRIVFPYAAGSTGDATARLLAQKLGSRLGQPLIVENRVGANGVIGTEAVARSVADGYTLLWAITPQIAIAPAMLKVPYDPTADFVPITAVSANTFALVVHPSVPARTVAEFINYVRDRPNGFAYAEGGAGSITHLSMVLFLNRAGLSGLNVSYKGTAPALNDVVAGHLPAMFSLFGDAVAQAKSGNVRLLALTGATRSAQVPSVPTIAESGFAGFKTTSWWGLMAPAGTPQPIVDRIAAETRRITQDRAFADKLKGFGVEPIGNTPAQFASMIAADQKLWATAVKLAGLAAR